MADPHHYETRFRVFRRHYAHAKGGMFLPCTSPPGGMGAQEQRTTARATESGPPARRRRQRGRVIRNSGLSIPPLPV